MKTSTIKKNKLSEYEAQKNSVKPSPNKDNPVTIAVIANPGNKAVHQIPVDKPSRANLKS